MVYSEGFGFLGFESGGIPNVILHTDGCDFLDLLGLYGVGLGRWTVLVALWSGVDDGS